MNEYDLYLPLHYNDGRAIPVEKLDWVKKLLADEFGGLTYFPQQNEGIWKFGDVTFRDRIIILRVLSRDPRHTRRFFAELRIELMRVLEQSDLLITEQEVHVIN
jgi:hypothetical protein